MSLRKNALSIAIASLLFASQSSFAAPITTTVTLNGVTRNLTFPSQADADTFFNTPTAAQQNQQQKLFENANGDRPTSADGLVSQTLLNGVPVTLTKIDNATYVLVQPKADGTLDVITLTKPAAGVLNDQGTQAKVLDVVTAYSKSVADPTVPFDAKYAPSVKEGATQATLDKVISNAAVIATSEVKNPAIFTDITIAPTEDASKAAQVAALVSQQEAKASLATASLPAAVAAPADFAVVPGIVKTLSQDPDVEKAAAADKLAAANAVLALSTVAADPQLKAYAKIEVSDAAAFNVTALKDVANSVTTGTLADKQAALTELDAALTTARTALSVATSDTNSAAADRDAAKTAAVAAAEAAKTASIAVVTAIKADPNATAADKTAADNVQTGLEQTVADITGTGTGGGTETATATLETASGKLSDASSAQTAIAEKVAQAKALLADPTELKATEIVGIRESLLKNNIMSTVQQAEALLVKAKGQGATVAQLQPLQAQIATLKASDAVQLYDKTAAAEYYVENTATNGIAGNPSSAMNLMVDGVFGQISNIGNGNVTNIAASSDNGIKHSLDVGLNYNYFNLHGTSVNNVNLTPSFSTKFDSKGQLILSLPLSYISGQVSNLDSYQVGTGIAYKYDVTDSWSITPAFNYAYRMVSNNSSATVLDQYNAVTLGDGVSMYGGSITNKFDFKWSGMNVSLTNLNGYFENIGDPENKGLGYTGVSGYGNDISNYVLKNGVSFGKNVAGYHASTYLTDTEYFSTGSKEVFFDQISEFGFAVKPESFGSNLNVSAGYMFSYKSGPKGDLDGFKLNVNYKFN